MKNKDQVNLMIKPFLKQMLLKFVELKSVQMIKKYAEFNLHMKKQIVEEKLFVMIVA